MRNGAILICRPQPGAEATARRVLEMGMEALIYPLFAVEPVAWEAPDAKEFDALMLTSANAVRHGGARLLDYRKLPVFAVGAATARAARDAGFDILFDGDENVEKVVAELCIDGYKNILHPGGQEMRPYDAEGLNMRRIAVYRTAERGSTEELARVLAHAQVALVHSPLAGARLAAMIQPEQRQHCALVAISPAALEAAGEGWRSAHSAERPNDEAMLALARQICHR